MMMWDCLITEVKPGDIWTGTDQVLVLEVGACDIKPGWVRIQGQIIVGCGKSNKLRAWGFPPEQRVDIIRPVSTWTCAPLPASWGALDD